MLERGDARLDMVIEKTPQSAWQAMNIRQLGVG